MKKLLSIFALVAVFGMNVQTAAAQTTTPRYGTVTGKDNTFRNLTNGYFTLTDAAGADSAVIVPKYFNTIYNITLLDSFTLKSPTVTSSYLGDRITLLVTAASGTPKLKFTGTGWLANGTATLSTNLRAVIQFIFDGAKYVEASRYVQ